MDVAEYSVYLLDRVHTVIEFDVIVSLRVSERILGGKADELFGRCEGRGSLTSLLHCFPNPDDTSNDLGNDKSALHGLSLDRFCRDFQLLKFGFTRDPTNPHFWQNRPEVGHPDPFAPELTC